MLLEFLESVANERNFLFFVSELVLRGKFPEKLVQLVDHVFDCKQKIPGKTFWIYDFLGVLLYLKFPWGRKWSRRCPEGSRKYNFSQLRWDKLHRGHRGRHRRRKVSDKWGPHELWRKLQMINFKVETLGPGFSCLGRTGTGAVSFSSPDDVLFGSLKGGLGIFFLVFVLLPENEK